MGLIGFAGLSDVGLVSSIAAAAKGHGVIAVDAREDLVRLLQVGCLPIHEPGLDDLLARHAAGITLGSQPADLRQCSLVMLSIDTAAADGNENDGGPLDRLADAVVPNLADGCVLVVLSQVRPGTTRRLAERFAATLTARKIQLCYQVETLLAGRAVERALFPERFMIGCADPGQSLPAAYHRYLASFKCPILPMRYESAELARIATNVFVGAAATAANTLSDVCEKIGADWSEIVPALKLDKRIGPHAHLSPGLGLAGGNFERDLATVQGLAAEHGSDARLIDAFAGNSQYRRDWALRTLLHALQHQTGDQPPVVAIWGLARSETNSWDRAPSHQPALALLSALTETHVQAYDPRVKLEGPLSVRFRQASTALEACDGADVLVVMTPWPEFRTANLTEVAARLRQPMVIDPFGCMDAAHAAQLGLSYFRLGFSVPRQRGEAA